MGCNIEKEIKGVCDSVNSGLIDDKLSEVVGACRSSASAGRQALADEEAEYIAAAGDADWRQNTGEKFEDWLEQVKESLGALVDRKDENEISDREDTIFF